MPDRCCGYCRAVAALKRRRLLRLHRLRSLAPLRLLVGRWAEALQLGGAEAALWPPPDRVGDRLARPDRRGGPAVGRGRDRPACATPGML